MMNGDFSNPPEISFDVVSNKMIEYFTLTLNPSVKSSYPKNITLSCYDQSNTLVKEITVDPLTINTLPNILFDIHTNNITHMTLTFNGTIAPHRRIRVANIMFGRMLTLTQDDMLNTDYLDKCSYVPDSIPSRTFDFVMNNYNKTYNIDNPNNPYISLNNQTKILMRNGYNIFGYVEDGDGNATINNPERIKLIEWDDWKELRLLNIVTNNDNTCKFECGSILDMMTDVYTAERFTNNRTVRYIIANLLNFMGLDTSIITFSSDDNGVSYGDYIINTVLPELPVRELIQLLAFSVGATLLIKDDGTIKFANLNLNDSGSFTHTHNFTYSDFTSIPVAEQLESTDKISLPKYNSTIDANETEITNVNVDAYNVDVSYSACVPTGARKAADDTSQGSVQSADLYATRGYLTMNIPVAGVATKVSIVGYRINTHKTQDRTITNDTLIIDTKLMSSDKNNVIKNKYKAWYNKKFKYSMNTRGEPLVDAGDYAIIQSPFSEQLNTYVLQNHIKFDGTWSGDMEVIAL